MHNNPIHITHRTHPASHSAPQDAWVKERASRVTESVPITEPGMCIVFNHFRLHEGAALLSGAKYIMRTDVLYRRQEGTATALTGEDEAKRLVQLADDLGACACVMSCAPVLTVVTQSGRGGRRRRQRRTDGRSD